MSFFLCLFTSSTLQHLSAVPTDAPAHVTRSACTDIVSDKRFPAGLGPDTHRSPDRGALAIVQHGQRTSTRTCTGAHTIPARQNLTSPSKNCNDEGKNKPLAESAQQLCSCHFIRQAPLAVFLSPPRLHCHPCCVYGGGEAVGGGTWLPRDSIPSRYRCHIFSKVGEE